MVKMSNDNNVFVTGISQQKSEQEPFKFTVSHGIWLSFGVIEAMIAVRIGLLLIGADPSNVTVALVYSFTHFFLLPFAGIIDSPTCGGILFEISSMFAMIIYVLIAGVVEKVVWLLLYHPIEPVTVNRGMNLNQIKKNNDDTLTR
jgi:hypothetical protein